MSPCREFKLKNEGEKRLFRIPFRDHSFAQFAKPHKNTTWKIMFSVARFSRPAASVLRRNASGKSVKFGVEGRALMLQGVDLLADAVQVCFCCIYVPYLLILHRRSPLVLKVVMLSWISHLVLLKSPKMV